MTNQDLWKRIQRLQNKLKLETNPIKHKQLERHIERLFDLEDARLTEEILALIKRIKENLDSYDKAVSSHLLMTTVADLLNNKK